MDNSYPARFGRLSFHYKSLFRAMESVKQAKTLAEAQAAAKWVLASEKKIYAALIDEDAETKAWLKQRIAEKAVAA